MEMEMETQERMVYRYKCKHFSYENCMKKSGYYGGIHLLMGCDGDCRRMKNYDNKIKKRKREQMKEKIIAYKGFNKDLTCRGFQYEVGKEYIEEKVSICNRGFHACENPFDVLDFYRDALNNRFCKVEQSGLIEKDDKKQVSSKIKVVAEIGFAGLFKAGVEWIKEITNPTHVIKETWGNNDENKIGSSGYSAKIGSSGDYAKIGSSGDSAKIDSTGEDSVICCAGDNSVVRAKKGSWITLSEWRYSEEKKRSVPVFVKTEYVDGEKIKEDTWYKLDNGNFVEVL